jgi:hypothetical protein
MARQEMRALHRQLPEVQRQQNFWEIQPAFNTNDHSVVVRGWSSATMESMAAKSISSSFKAPPPPRINLKK